MKLESKAKHDQAAFGILKTGSTQRQWRQVVSTEPHPHRVLADLHPLIHGPEPEGTMVRTLPGLLEWAIS